MSISSKYINTITVNTSSSAYNIANNYYNAIVGSANETAVAVMSESSFLLGNSIVWENTSSSTPAYSISFYDEYWNLVSNEVASEATDSIPLPTDTSENLTWSEYEYNDNYYAQTNTPYFTQSPDPQENQITYFTFNDEQYSISWPEWIDASTGANGYYAVVNDQYNNSYPISITDTNFGNFSQVMVLDGDIIFLYRTSTGLYSYSTPFLDMLSNNYNPFSLTPVVDSDTGAQLPYNVIFNSDLSEYVIDNSGEYSITGTPLNFTYIGANAYIETIDMFFALYNSQGDYITDPFASAPPIAPALPYFMITDRYKSFPMSCGIKVNKQYCSPKK